jgi:2-beta-glucuronyltransferase
MLLPDIEPAQQPAKRALLLSQQTIGLGYRMTGMVFWAETLADMGWEIGMVTVQLSRLTEITNPSRFSIYPSDAINRWRDRGRNRRGYLWVPPIHPMRLPARWLDPVTMLAAKRYGASLPKAILDEAAQADLIVIESTAAVAVFETLRKAAPHARFVYCASDRLVPNGMSPVLQDILERTAPFYDLVRVPAQSMISDFPPGTNIHHIPHGVDRAAFAVLGPNPYPPGSCNLVVAGDGAYDPVATSHIARAMPEATVHLFGRMRPDSLGSQPNARFYGEVPFRFLVPYLQHADIGLAPYEDRPNRNYFAESSLRQLQYILCKLPIVLPTFAAPHPQPFHYLYDAHRPETAGAAARAALDCDRTAISDSDVIDWRQVIARVLYHVGLDSAEQNEPASS